MRLQKTIAAFVATVGVSSSALGGNTDNFPRLATLAIGGAQNYDSSWQTFAARHHLAVFGTIWDGWEASRGYSRQSVASSIKAQSTVGTRVFLFGPSLDQMSNTPGVGSDQVLVNKWRAMNWYLYASGTSGSMVSFDTYPQTNMTSASPRDGATGLGPFAWGAKYAYEAYHLGLYGSVGVAAPSIDGVMLDNQFWRPRVDGDWFRNNTGSTSQNDATVQLNYRTGEKTYFDQMKAMWPTGVFMGNVADWYPGNDSSGYGSSVAPFSGTGPMGGAFYEQAIGASFSVETWGGSAAMQQQYSYIINNVNNPKWVLFSHNLTSASGSDAYGPNWQAMRYGLCATLMNNGYYFANKSQSVYVDTDHLWFDEYDGGGLGVGYLGQPLSSAAGAAQTAAWSNGVWKREFANGIALWNPKGNGTQSISLSGLGTLKHFSGNQNPSLNNGSTVTNGSVTLQDRDGIILMRLTAVKVPQAPSGLKLQN